MFSKVLAEREVVLGPDHLDTLKAMFNVGITLHKLNDTFNAIRMFERAVEKEERLLGKNDVTAIKSSIQLASFKATSGDLKGAGVIYERCVSALERAYGCEHTETLLATEGYAQFLKRAGDLPGAVAMIARVVEAKERVFGPEHRSTLHSLSILGVMLLDLRRFSEARQTLERAHVGMDKVYGSTSEESLFVGYQLSLLDFTEGRYCTAVQRKMRYCDGLRRTRRKCCALDVCVLSLSTVSTACCIPFHAMGRCVCGYPSTCQSPILAMTGLMFCALSPLWCVSCIMERTCQ